MNITLLVALTAILLGIIEGITEFLPISSTFHLIFASKFLGVVQNDFSELFIVVIQAGAVLSAVILYFSELKKNRKLLQKIIYSFIPTAIIALPLHKIAGFKSEELMIGAFFVMGIAFLIVESNFKKSNVVLAKKIKNITYKDAVIIGVIQALAAIPGVSRAGSVMLGMMLMGYNREESAKYSFMLAIPTILAASFFDLVKMRGLLFSTGGNVLFYLLIGTVAAFITSYIVIKWFIKYLQTHSLQLFGWYRLLLVIIILLWMSLSP